MSWVRISDDIPLHPRSLQAGLAAFGLWTSGLAFANRHMTDGYLPENLMMVFPGEKRSYLLRLATRLVEVGLWAKVDPSTGAVPGVTGIPAYLISNYSECQPSATRKSQIQRRTESRERQQRFRKKTTDQEPLSRCDTRVVAPVLDPDPDPDPDPNSTGNGDAAAQTSGHRPELRSFVLRFFSECYEKKRGDAWLQSAYFDRDLRQIATYCKTEIDAKIGIENYFRLADEFIQSKNFSPTFLAKNWGMYRNPPEISKASPRTGNDHSRWELSNKNNWIYSPNDPPPQTKWDAFTWWSKLENERIRNAS